MPLWNNRDFGFPNPGSPANFLPMGRQWLHAKRAVASVKKAQATGKIVREIMVAAKMGGPDPHGNARLAAAVEKARKESVSRDVIERAIKKGAGVGDDKLVMEHVVFEGYAPGKVPVIVEVYTDNVNRTAPEIRNIFKKGQLGTSGSNRFLFDNVGLVEAYHASVGADLEAAAIEAGANEVEALSPEQNDDIPAGTSGARFVMDRAAVHAVSSWLRPIGTATRRGRGVSADTRRPRRCASRVGCAEVTWPPIRCQALRNSLWRGTAPDNVPSGYPQSGPFCWPQWFPSIERPR
jgi:YebC/PmpR family DNA-binding regulatory protein